MQRREFILAVGGTAATWPLAARAQPSGRVYRIGWLTIGSRGQQLHLIKAFEEGLRSLGYRVSENIIIEYRFADGEIELLPELAANLVQLGVDVIVTGNISTGAAMKATATIPIVTPNSADPVTAGLVTSLARPGGNVTGFTQDTGGELNGKRLESGLAQSIARPGWNVTGNVIPHELVLKRIQIMRDIIPNLHRIAILYNKAAPGMQGAHDALHDAARQFGIEVHDGPFTSAQDVAVAMEGIVESGCEAIFTLPTISASFCERRSRPRPCNTESPPCLEAPHPFATAA